MVYYWPNGSLQIPTVTSEYNPSRSNPVTGVVQPHRGIDLVGFTDNCSPCDGTVLFAGYNGPAGNEVRIRADGPTAFHAGDCFRILHNASLYVSTGQRVSARQAVGRMGTTGQSTGIHCHFETHEWRLWNYVNPRDFMSRANAGSVAGGGSTPFVEGFFMALSDAEQRELLDGVRNLYAAMFIGGPSMQDQGRSVSYSLGNLTVFADQIRGMVSPILRNVDGKDTLISLRQEVADTKTGVLALLGRDPGRVDVDEDALAAALAPLIATQLGRLSDEDVARLAEAVTDEHARRLSGKEKEN